MKNTWVKLPPHIEAFKIMLESAEIDYEEGSDEDSPYLEINNMRFRFGSEDELLSVEDV